MIVHYLKHFTTMKKASLLLLTVLALAFASPAHAAFIMKKTAPAKSEAATVSNTEAVATQDAGKDQISDAVEEFRNLPRAERAERVHAAREELRNFQRAPGDSNISTLLLVIIAILLPPLAVGLHDRGLSTRFWIDLLLTLLFYIPGLIYALIVILGK
jgi:uncharacterized membrane protein YqaE (UPF0057 family)